MTGPCYPIRTESRFHRQERSFTLLSAPVAALAVRDDAPTIERVVLIVLPPGPEQARSYRLLRELAVMLAISGIPTLRLELSGTGHSAQASSSTRLADWHEDILDAAAVLQARWPTAQLLGAGVRYGVRLLVDAFLPSVGPGTRTSSCKLAGLVGWSPLLRGRDWVEHLHQVQEEMASAGLQLDEHDLAGETWSAEFLAELQAQNALADLDSLDFESTFILDVNSRIGGLEATNQLVRGISSNDWVSSSLPMLVSGETSAALLSALQRDYSWSAVDHEPKSHPSSARGHSDPNGSPDTSATLEQPFCLGATQAIVTTDQAYTHQLDQGLFGVYRSGRAACPVVVMLNSGLLGCSGPYRLYVETAQRLAEQGIASVRFDFSGKGESPRKPLSAQKSLLDDYAQLTDFLYAKGHQETILLGICSGADDALELAQIADNVAGLVLLDGYAPKTVGYTRHYMQQRLTSPSRMQRWLKRKGAALMALARADKFDDSSAPLELRSWESPAMMRDRYLSVLDRQCNTLAVFTGALLDDYYNHQDQLANALGEPAGLSEHFLPHLNHLYPAASQRKELVELIATWANENFIGRASDKPPENGVR